MAGRRKFSREFKVEAVSLVLQRGVTIAQAARDLDLNVNVLRGWVKAHRADPAHAFPAWASRSPRMPSSRDCAAKSRAGRWNATS